MAIKGDLIATSGIGNKSNAWMIMHEATRNIYYMEQGVSEINDHYIELFFKSNHCCGRTHTR